MKILSMVAVVIGVAATLFVVCSRSNNILLGRVEAKVGSHIVVVTDCYRIRVPAPEKLAEGPDGQPSYRFAPCRDAEVLIRDGELVVNGQAYGPLHDGDSITVDHGHVLINEADATAISR